MDSFFGILYGLIFGVLGALFVAVAWAIMGIIREYALGCLGGFITFVIVELPVWVGLPIQVGMVVTFSNRNLFWGEFALGIYVITIVVLLSKNVVTIIRAYIENGLLRRR